MKVSVIIPCYNQGEYLADAIDSALQQEYAPLEVIVVNDGSTDNSLEVAHEFDPVITIVNQSNKGLAGARNAGVLNSTGDALVMLDADDCLDHRYVDKTLAQLKDGVGIVCSACLPFGEMQENEVWHAAWPTVESIKERNTLFYCSLMRREAFLQTGGYNPRMTWGYEDWNLWVDIIKRGWATVIIDDPLFHYRVKKQSMYVTARSHHEELVAQMRQLHPELYGCAGRVVPT